MEGVSEREGGKGVLYTEAWTNSAGSDIPQTVRRGPDVLAPAEPGVVGSVNTALWDGLESFMLQ